MSFLLIIREPLLPRVITTNLQREERAPWQFDNLSFLNKLNASDLLQKTISTYSLIYSKKLSLCLSTQNESDNERIIFVFDSFAICAALRKAFLANSLSHK